MKSKCLVCSKKNNKSSVILTEWIINYKDKAHTGKKVEIHTDCLSDRLYYEKADGYVYGKVISK